MLHGGLPSCWTSLARVGANRSPRIDLEQGYPPDLMTGTVGWMIGGGILGNAVRQRTLLLALTVYPLNEVWCQPASRDPPQSGQRSCSEKKFKRHGSGIDKASLHIFNNISWHTVKMLLGLLDSVQDGLSWLFSCVPGGVSEMDACYMRTGKDLLKRLNEEHANLEKDVSVLEGELLATRDSLVKLTRENKVLKHKLEASTEAGLILEQDRNQLQALLEDKGRLQEENSRLRREIDALQELLEYAAEHVVEEMGSQMLEDELRTELGQDIPGADPPLMSSTEIKVGYH